MIFWFLKYLWCRCSSPVSDKVHNMWHTHHIKVLSIKKLKQLLYKYLLVSIQLSFYLFSGGCVPCYAPFRKQGSVIYNIDISDTKKSSIEGAKCCYIQSWSPFSHILPMGNSGLYGCGGGCWHKNDLKSLQNTCKWDKNHKIDNTSNKQHRNQ